MNKKEGPIEYETSASVDAGHRVKAGPASPAFKSDHSSAAAVTVVESGNGPYAQFVRAGRHALTVDEPEALGGHDAGPSPYEYILAGLGACTAMTLRMYAARHGWPLERVSVELRHARTQRPDRSGELDRFERLITLVGDLSDEQRDRLLAIAEQCPVSRTLRRPSEIVSRLA
jgi:putative redox protein